MASNQIRSASTTPIPAQYQNTLDNTYDKLKKLVNSDSEAPFALPDFEKGERVCEQLIHSLDIVVGRNCFRKPNFFHRDARELYQSYAEKIKTKKKYLQEIKNICTNETRKDQNAQMSLDVYTNLVGVASSVYHLADRSESVYQAITKAEEDKVKRDIQNNELQTAKVNNVATIINALANFVPDISVL